MSLRRLNPKRDVTEIPIVQALRECGAEVFRLSGKGIPDLLCFWGMGSSSKAFLVECKTKGGKLTPEQERFHQEARFRGWPVFVMHTPDQALGIINVISRREPDGACLPDHLAGCDV